MTHEYESFKDFAGGTVKLIPKKEIGGGIPDFTRNIKALPAGVVPYGKRLWGTGERIVRNEFFNPNKPSLEDTWHKWIEDNAPTEPENWNNSTQIQQPKVNRQKVKSRQNYQNVNYQKKIPQTYYNVGMTFYPYK